jgi:allophanate hydrolase
VGVPREADLQFFGHEEYPHLFKAACEQLRAAGAELIEIELTAFIEAAKLLYQGPWVAERTHAVGEFVKSHLSSVNPVVASIVEGGWQCTAVQAFDGLYALKKLKRSGDEVLATVDAIVTPTVPQHYTIEQLNAEPILRNSELGYYTNFMNLLDYSAVAVPAGFTARGLPFGITLFAEAFCDNKLNHMAQRFLSLQSWSMGASGIPMPTSDTNTKTTATAKQAVYDNLTGYIPVAVCGAHLSGMPLNGQLLERNATLIESTNTAACYTFYALAGGPPKRPGLVRSEGEGEGEGESIHVEVWAVPQECFGSFVAGIPAPCGVVGAEDITHYKNWQDYVGGG